MKDIANNTIKTIAILLIYNCICIQSVVAQQDTISTIDLAKLSLEELLNLEVDISTKQDQTINKSPGSVNIFSNDEIVTLKAFRLADLANLTPGYSQSNKQYGELGLATRGNAASSFENNKHLLLIDGVPFHDVRSYKVPIDYNVPLYFAKDVAFMRGPGGSLYGNSSLLGSIGITSKELQKNKTILFEGFSTMANLWEGNQLFFNTIVKGKNTLTKLFYGKTKAGFEGERKQITNTQREFNDFTSTNFIYFSHNITLNKKGHLDFGLIYCNRETGLGESWELIGATLDQIYWNTGVAFVKYQKDYSHNWQLKSLISYNSSGEKGDYTIIRTNEAWQEAAQPVYREYKRKNSAIYGNLEIWKKFNKNSSLLLGSDFDLRGWGNNKDSYDVCLYSFAPENNSSSVNETTIDDYGGQILFSSVFAQIQTEIPFIKDLTITAGIREDYNHSPVNDYFQTSPRISLIKGFNNMFFIKANYGKGFRGPSLKAVILQKEQITRVKNNNINTDFIKDIKAESSDNIEFSIQFKKQKIFLEAVAFYNELTNAINKKQATIPGTENIEVINYFYNKTGIIKALGYEVELKAQLLPSLIITMGRSFSKVNTQTDNPIPYIPATKHHLMTYFKNENFIVSGASLSFYHFENIYLPDNNFASSMQMNASIDIKLPQKFTLNLEANNILGSTLYDYSLSADGNTIKIPRLDRQWVIGIQYRFEK
jgi:outer membrane receptor protein involved in Fe transport